MKLVPRSASALRVGDMHPGPHKYDNGFGATITRTGNDSYTTQLIYWVSKDYFPVSVPAGGQQSGGVFFQGNADETQRFMGFVRQLRTTQ